MNKKQRESAEMTMNIRLNEGDLAMFYRSLKYYIMDLDGSSIKLTEWLMEKRPSLVKITGSLTDLNQLNLSKEELMELLAMYNIKLTIAALKSYEELDV